MKNTISKFIVLAVVAFTAQDYINAFNIRANYYKAVGDTKAMELDRKITFDYVNWLKEHSTYWGGSGTGGTITNTPVGSEEKSRK